MRRWSLVLLLSTASPVLAQEAQEAPAAPAAEQAPSASEPTQDTEKPTRRRRRAKKETPAAQEPGPARQETAEPAPAAQAPEPAPAPTTAAPGNEAPVPAPQSGSDRDVVREEARYLLGYLLTGDVRRTVPMLAFPFQLEERRFDTPESLVVAWVKELRNKRTDLITLYDIEVLPYAEMEKKYGQPPARLGAIIPRGTEVYAAVANLSGRAAVLLYQQTGEGWRAFAYTD